MAMKSIRHNLMKNEIQDFLLWCFRRSYVYRIKYFEVKIKIALISKKNQVYLLKGYSILLNMYADPNRMSGKNPENNLIWCKIQKTFQSFLKNRQWKASGTTKWKMKFKISCFDVFEKAMYVYQIKYFEGKNQNCIDFLTKIRSTY